MLPEHPSWRKLDDIDQRPEFGPQTVQCLGFQLVHPRHRYVERCVNFRQFELSNKVELHHQLQPHGKARHSTGQSLAQFR